MLCFWCKTKAILRAWMLLKGTGTCGVPEISETFNFRRPKVPFFTMKSQSKTQIPQGSPFFWFLLHSHINDAYHLERIDDDRHSHLSFGSSWAQKKLIATLNLGVVQTAMYYFHNGVSSHTRMPWMYPYFMINWAVPTWWKPRITTELPRNLHTSQDFAAGVAWHRCRGVVCLAWWEKQAWKVTRKAHW